MSNCAQCKAGYRACKTALGCPKCAPGVVIEEIEFRKPISMKIQFTPDALKQLLRNAISDKLNSDFAIPQSGEITLFNVNNPALKFDLDVMGLEMEIKK